MNKVCTLFLLTVLCINSSLAQNNIPPDYLTQQEFPDSVKNLVIQKLNGEKSTFANTLELYKGKKIVLDIWASWCRDCIIGLPKLEELKQQTGIENTVYLFISVDKDETKWRTAITRFNIQGEHYRIETGWYSPLSNYIDLDWVPRYLVLNENGRIILPKAITADNQDLIKMLSK